MTTYDFRDGNGPVPAHRHKNPDGSEGGWVAETAHVDKTVYVSGSARVSGSASVSGSARVEKTPINIIGLIWDVTITDVHIAIGCQCHPIKGWAKWTPKQVAHMHPDAEKFWKAHKTTIMALAKGHTK